MDIERFRTLAVRGLSLFRSRRLDEALPTLEAAARAYSPSGPEARLPADPMQRHDDLIHSLYVEVTRALAGVSADRGDYDGAIRYFIRVLEQAPSETDAYLGLVRAAASAGRHGEARRYYRLYRVRMEKATEPPAAFPGPGRP